MPEAVVYPGGLAELDFLECYRSATLRKPQVAADAALRTLVLAGQSDRILLVGLIGDLVAESARRLVAVYDALADRTLTVARALVRPLPGAPQWRLFIDRAASLSPEDMLRHLNLGDTALDAAERLRSQPDLSRLTPLVEAASSGNAMILVPGLDGRRAPEQLLVSAIGDSAPVSVALSAREEDAAMLADLTADLSSIARGFLGAYLHARQSAGRRD